MTVFYAYATNINDDNAWRWVITFASRSIADEWWRVVSSVPTSGVTRINPQFYTHTVVPFNIGLFFIDPLFVNTRSSFQGKIFFSLLWDRAGRDLSAILPPCQDITDYTSGSRFFIRSKSDHSRYWFAASGDNQSAACFYCGNTNCQLVHVSTMARTRFCVRIARDMPDGTVMIGSDKITISTHNDGVALVNDAGSLVIGSAEAPDFVFGDFVKGFRTKGVGAIQLAPGGNAVFREDVVRSTDNQNGEEWELVN